MARWLMLAAVGVLSCSWAQADTVEPGHYTITLTDWDNNQDFNFTPNPSDLNTSSFTNPDNFCPGFEGCFDPSIRVDPGGKSTPEDGNFSFSTGSDAAGNTVVLDYANTGTPINSILITLTSNGGQLNPDQLGEVFTCDGGSLFTNCGFYNDAFQIAFWNTADVVGIPTATTPEPSQWIILLFASAAMIVARARKRSAS
ncbi:MAG: hypothetical protein ACLPWF_19325 [Bryobacteraceae bacterium]